MKLGLFIALSILTTGNFVRGQDSLINQDQKFVIRDLPTAKIKSPLYIVKVDNKVLQIPRNGNLSNTRKIKRTIGLINADWIESIEVIKDKSAVEKYGPFGRNGVLVLNLQRGTFDKLPVKLRKCRTN